VIAKSIVATALVYSAEAWARILSVANRTLVARLLGQMLSVVPDWMKAKVGVKLDFG
jgi:ABC-type uncharacterized transport system permease subunit